MAAATHIVQRRRRHRVPWTCGGRLLGYDPELRRVWVGGQRLHHGVTGIALTGAGVLGVAARRFRASRGAVWALTGTALVAHDWKDRALWFRRGPQPD